MKGGKNWLQKHRRELACLGLAVVLAVVTAVAFWLLTGRGDWHRAGLVWLAALAVWGLLVFCLDRVLYAPRLTTRLGLGMLGAAVALAGMAAGIQFWLWHRGLPPRIWLLPPAVAVLLLCLAGHGLARRLLAPLEELRTAVEDACRQGAGPQMDLNGTAHTELYEIGRLFNLFSLRSRTRQNALQAANETYRQLVPAGLLDLLGKSDVTELIPGKTEPLRGDLLVVMPDFARPDAVWLDRMVETLEKGGAVVGYDLSCQALLAAFDQDRRTVECAGDCIRDHAAVAAILRQEAGFGFFGGAQGLYPVARIPGIGRRLAVLAMLRGFGARLLYSGGDGDGLRLLGWDDGQPFYEDTTLRPAEWQAGWRKAAPLWTEALTLYRARAFSAAMRRLADVLHILPDEEAARWYLFRCHALRDRPAAYQDLDLLYEGERTR